MVAAALLVDATLGEPPERFHPTVWMGQAISALESPGLRIGSPRGRRVAGLFLAAALPSVAFLSSRAMLHATPRSLRPIVEVSLLSTTLSMRGLGEAALGVRGELAGGRLEEARRLVGRFVGRDTEGLCVSDVCRAAVESVAENTSDGVVAPMLYGYLFGAPGALAYKAINTADSMIGHRNPRHGDLGRAGARLDDLANLVPARLTVLACAVASGSPESVLDSASRYGHLTASPNAGRVEAAFAGALGVRLGGTNSYGGVERRGPVLGDGGPPDGGDIGRAVALMRRICAMLAVAALLFGRR
jgi:adenosylcobinamide-phosphate synthase